MGSNFYFAIKIKINKAYDIFNNGWYKNCT